MLCWGDKEDPVTEAGPPSPEARRQKGARDVPGWREDEGCENNKEKSLINNRGVKVGIPLISCLGLWMFQVHTIALNRASLIK